MKKHAGTIQQLLLALALALGAFVVGAGAFGFLEGTFRSLFATTSVTQINFTSDGEPYLSHWDSASADWTHTDLDGKPISADLSSGSGASISPISPFRLGQDLTWSERISDFSVTDRRVTRSLWYLIHAPQPDGGSYLVGYSGQSKQRIGFIGTSGFRTQPLPPDEWFAVKDYQPWYATTEQEDGSVITSQFTVALNCGSQVINVDLETHELRVVAADLPLPIRATSLISRRKMNYLVLLTDEVLYLLDTDYKLQSFPLPPVLRGLDFYTFALRADGGLNIEIRRPEIFDSSYARVALYVLAADGTLSGPRNVDLEQSRGGGDAGLVLVGTPVPEILGVGLVDASWHHFEGVESHGQYVKLCLWRDRWSILAATLEAILVAGLAYSRLAQRQFPRWQRILWVAFVFVFGIPGWIGFRYGRHWPVLEPCPLCEKPSPRNDEVCAVCGRDFPLPKLKGTEIFA